MLAVVEPLLLFDCLCCCVWKEQSKSSISASLEKNSWLPNQVGEWPTKCGKRLKLLNANSSLKSLVRRIWFYCTLVVCCALIEFRGLQFCTISWYLRVPRKQATISKSICCYPRSSRFIPCRFENGRKGSFGYNLTGISIVIIINSISPCCFERSKEPKSHGCIIWLAFSSRQYNIIPLAMQRSDTSMLQWLLWPSTKSTTGHSKKQQNIFTPIKKMFHPAWVWFTNCSFRETIYPVVSEPFHIINNHRGTVASTSNMQAIKVITDLSLVVKL